MHLPYPSVWPCWFRYFSCILYRYLVYWSFLCSWMYVWSQWIYLTASVWIMLERWLLQEVCFFSYLRGIHFYFCFLFLFSSSSWLTPVHEKDLVLCLMRILARCVEVLRQFDFPLKGRSELFEPRRGEFWAETLSFLGKADCLRTSASWHPATNIIPSLSHGPG